MIRSEACPLPPAGTEELPLPIERGRSCRFRKSAPFSLRQNMCWTVSGNLAYTGCQWGMLVVLAKLTDPETVGLFVLGLALTAPILLFSNLNLRAVLSTDAKHEYPFRDYLGLRLITTAAGLSVLGIFLLVADYVGEAVSVIVLIGVSKGFEFVGDIFYGLFQRFERMDRIGRSMMLKGPLSLLALAGGLYFFGSLKAGILGLVCVNALVLLFYDAENARVLLKASQEPNGPRRRFDPVLKPRFRKTALVKLACTSAPLGGVALLLSLNVNIPRYFIEHYQGTGALGVYAALAYIIVGGTMVVNALGQAAGPRLANHHHAGDRHAFLKLVRRLLFTGFLFGALGIAAAFLIGREALAVLYTPRYAEQAHLFILLTVAGMLQYIQCFLGTAVTSMRIFKTQAVVHCVNILLVAICSMTLIRSHGLAGAAYTAMISGVFMISTYGYLAFSKASALSSSDSYATHERIFQSNR